MGAYRCSAEFRVAAVALARSSDRPLAQVAWDLGVDQETLRQWVKSADRSEDPAAGAEDVKDAEIARLRRQVRELETERKILRKAAKYFARDRRAGDGSLPVRRGEARRLRRQATLPDPGRFPVRVLPAPRSNTNSDPIP